MQFDPNTQTKQCSRCKQVKSPDDFALNCTQKDGRANTCKQCNQRIYREQHPLRPRPNIDSVEGMRHCYGCKELKPISAFYRCADPDRANDGKHKNGIYRLCRTCSTRKTIEYKDRLKGGGPRVHRETKICSVCGLSKSRTCFTKNRSLADWLDPICRDCQRAKAALKESREYRFEFNLWKRYRLRTEDYNKMLQLQGNVCAICEQTFSGSGARHKSGVNPSQWPNVDHSHVTGKVRALLCSRCNVRLGLLEQDEWVKRAFAYLEKHRDQ